MCHFFAASVARSKKKTYCVSCIKLPPSQRYPTRKFDLTTTLNQSHSHSSPQTSLQSVRFGPKGSKMFSCWEPSLVAGQPQSPSWEPSLDELRIAWTSKGPEVGSVEWVGWWSCVLLESPTVVIGFFEVTGKWDCPRVCWDWHCVFNVTVDVQKNA